MLLEQTVVRGMKVIPSTQGWSGGAMVLGKLPVQGRLADLDSSSPWACCACSTWGWGCLDIFALVYHFSLLSSSLWEAVRYRLKYCLKGPLSPKQPINQLFHPLLYTPFHSRF